MLFFTGIGLICGEMPCLCCQRDAKLVIHIRRMRLGFKGLDVEFNLSRLRTRNRPQACMRVARLGYVRERSA